MPPLVRTCLYLSSLLVFFSCSPVRGLQQKGKRMPGREEIVPVAGKASVIYSTELKVYNKRYSGLIVLKETAADTAHLLFITQLGMKMFDFELLRDSLHLRYIFEPLNRPDLISLLKTDFDLMLLNPLFRDTADVFEGPEKTVFRISDKHRYYFKVGQREVREIVVRGRIFAKKKLRYEYNERQIPVKINLKHKGFLPLRINLVELQKTKE